MPLKVATCSYAYISTTGILLIFDSRFPSDFPHDTPPNTKLESKRPAAQTLASYQQIDGSSNHKVEKLLVKAYFQKVTNRERHGLKPADGKNERERPRETIARASCDRHSGLQISRPSYPGWRAVRMRSQVLLIRIRRFEYVLVVEEIFCDREYDFVGLVRLLVLDCLVSRPFGRFGIIVVENVRRGWWSLRNPPRGRVGKL